jgi:hypothetical protein
MDARKDKDPDGGRGGRPGQRGVGRGRKEVKPLLVFKARGRQAREVARRETPGALENVRGPSEMERLYDNRPQVCVYVCVYVCVCVCVHHSSTTC